MRRLTKLLQESMPLKGLPSRWLVKSVNTYLVLECPTSRTADEGSNAELPYLTWVGTDVPTYLVG
jgi:hypothetical protein